MILTSAAYQLLSEARGLVKEYQYLRVRIKTEQCRLLDWASVAKLTERDETLLLNRASRTVLINVLDQQRRLLMQYGRLDSRLQPLTNPLILEETANEIAYAGESNIGEPEDGSFESESLDGRFPHSGDLLGKSLRFIARTSKFPARLRWAVSDRRSLDDLIQKLTALNDYLAELLNVQQLDLLMTRQVRTDYLIVQMNSKLDHLQEIVEAGLAPHLPNPSRPQQQSLEYGEFDHHATSYTESLQPQRLTNLAQFKALSSAMETNSLTDEFAQKLELGESVEEITSVELSPRDITLIDSQNSIRADKQRADGWYSSSTGKAQPVWIEWKPFESQAPFDRNTVTNRKIIRRLSALVALLRENKRTEQFRAAPCLGFFLSEAHTELFRFGLVFERPAGVEPNATPVSLFELLQDSEGKIPSLTSRVALARAIAECIEKLYAVNWLHKGLRSDNVLFFRSERVDCNFSKPYLSGFDYSRPAQREDMTERPAGDVAHDLYRHPQVQGMARDTTDGKGYKKRHDIYSLAIVLVEIAHWRNIDSILGLEQTEIRPSDTAQARGRLLNGGYLDHIHSNLGDTIHGVIRSCLLGVTAFGIPEEANEIDVFVGAKLQTKFYTLVIQKLQGIEI